MQCNFRIACSLSLLLNLISTAAVYAATLGPISWANQFGTPRSDDGWAVAVEPAGKSVVASRRYLEPTYSIRQTHLSLFDASGSLLWDVIHGESGRPSQAFGVDFDQEGNIYIAGHTSREIDGRWWSNTLDLFVAKYNSFGEHLWTTIDEYGRLGSNSGVSDLEIAPDGNIYVSGYRESDAFLSRWSPSGQLDWLQTIPKQGLGVLRTAGVEFFNDDTIYVAGYTGAMLQQPLSGDRDSFVASYDSDGNLSWLVQRTDPMADEPIQAAVDSEGSLLVVGSAGEEIASSTSDSLIFKVDVSGNEVWSRTLQQPGKDAATVIKEIGNGRLLFGGSTTGGFGAVAGESHQYFGFIDSEGNIDGLNLLGPAGETTPHSLDFNQEFGSVWIAGSTLGQIGEVSYGGRDVYVMRVVVPEPASLSLGIIACLLIAAIRTMPSSRFLFVLFRPQFN